MHAKQLSILLLSLALLAVCGLSTVIVFGTIQWAQTTGGELRLLDWSATPATSRTSAQYPVAGAIHLDADTAAGGITVTKGAANVIEVETIKQAWGHDAASAASALARAAVQVQPTADGLTLRYQPPERINLFGNHPRTDTVSFTIRVPDSTTVKLATRAGPVTLSGTGGASDVGSVFGDVTVNDVHGPLTAHSSNGDIVVRHIAAGHGDVKLTTAFGDVNAADMTGARLTLTTSNGDVVVAGAHGALALKSDFGDITVTDATNATLDAHSSNGDIDFTGSLDPRQPHTARTDFGSIRLSIPVDSAFDILFHTDFGQINSDLPVTQREDVDSHHWVGSLNGGGPVLTASSANGSIHLTGRSAATPTR